MKTASLIKELAKEIEALEARMRELASRAATPTRDDALEEAAASIAPVLPDDPDNKERALWHAALKWAQNRIRALKGNAAPQVAAKDGASEMGDSLTTRPAESAFHPCTCHPDDNPPRPCPQKFALSECRKAAHRAKVEAEIQDAWERESLSDLCLIARRLLWAA